MHDNWRQIISFGPRPMGSAAAEKCSVFLEKEMKNIFPQTETDIYHVQDWSTDGWQLHIQGCENLESYLFLGSGASERFEGHLEFLGKNRLWNMYSWDRYAVVDKKGETVAYVTVRENGRAIPQMLFTGGTELPHFLVGEERKQDIENAATQKSYINGYAAARWKPGKCRDIVGSAENENLQAVKKKIVICSHYDTVYNTVGAYDNAAGVAVTLELARRLKERQLKYSVEVVLTDGEEYNLTGSRSRVKKWGTDNIVMALCIDGVGREKTLEVWSGPEPFERRIRKILKESNEIFTPVYQCPPPPGSDQEAYYAAGVPSCMLTFNDQGILHLPEDIYEEDKLENMKVMVNIAVELLEKLNIVDGKKEKEL